MIIVQLIGGLGNQMFQYAMARRLAYIHNVPLKFDITSYETNSLRKYALHHFNVIEDIASPEDIIRTKQIRHIRQKYFHFDPEILNVPSDAYLEGYWQSEKYFMDIKELIRAEFTFKNEPLGPNEEMVRKIKSHGEAVSLHVRRGDYVSIPVHRELHDTCSLEYYSGAVQRFATVFGNPHFYIFSDDWQWVQENIKIEYPHTFVTLNGPDHHYEDLRLMSFCKHHIIANSTFSWWGAWLSDDFAKMVHIPQKWFNDQNRDTRDLIPETWNSFFG